jgi:predicted Zn-dependent protease with MMP-like domain
LVVKETRVRPTLALLARRAARFVSAPSAAWAFVFCLAACSSTDGDDMSTTTEEDQPAGGDDSADTDMEADESDDGTPVGDGDGPVSDDGEEPLDDGDEPVDDGEEPDLSELDAVCTPGFDLNLTDDDPGRVALFMDAVDGDPEGTVQEIGRAVCKLLYRHPEEVRDATHLELRIEHAVGEVAWKAGDGGEITVMISTDHIQNVANEGRDVAEEVKGVLFHEITHMFQHDDNDGNGVDGGLIEGIADFVRIRAGYPPYRSQPNPNGNWNDGYHTTAYFLLWLDDQVEDFTYQLNLSMSDKDMMSWSPEAFRTITGKSVDELWDDYVDSF